MNLVRIEQGAEAGDEPYWKLDEEIDTAALAPLAGTFAPLDRDAILEEGRALVDFFRDRAPRVAESHGLPYPNELERICLERMNTL